MSPRKERTKKECLLMMQSKELHSGGKELTTFVSFSTTVSDYSHLLAKAHPNSLIIPGEW